MDNLQRILGGYGKYFPTEYQLDTYNPGNVRMSDVVSALTTLKETINVLRERLELQDLLLSALIGDKKERDEFVQHLRYHTNDNFKAMKIMNALNEIRPLKQKEEEWQAVPETIKEPNCPRFEITEESK